MGCRGRTVEEFRSRAPGAWVREREVAVPQFSASTSSSTHRGRRNSKAKTGSGSHTSPDSFQVAFDSCTGMYLEPLHSDRSRTEQVLAPKCSQVRAARSCEAEWPLSPTWRQAAFLIDVPLRVSRTSRLPAGGASEVIPIRRSPHPFMRHSSRITRNDSPSPRTAGQEVLPFDPSA
jgi:hypothetical protein